jgi:hypothetical protein
MIASEKQQGQKNSSYYNYEEKKLFCCCKNLADHSVNECLTIRISAGGILLSENINVSLISDA